MKYKKQHIANAKKIIRDMKPEYLTIHSTGNPNSSAQNERDWLDNRSNTSSTGFHIAVDDKQAIECISLNKVAYHAGDGAYGIGNSKSIGLEMCESGNRARTIERAVKVSAHILHERGWDISKLKRHFDWSGKNCPRILNTNNWQGWTDFKKKVLAHLNSLEYNDIAKDKLYKVQVGAFANKANATNLMMQLEYKGFKGIIVEEDIETPITPEKPIDKSTSEYYVKHDLAIIETDVENIYISTLPGKNLRQFGVYGINGTWQNNAEAHLSRSIWGLAVNAGKPIGPNSHQNSPNGTKRGTLVCYEGNSMVVRQINNVGEIDKPIKWAIGGGSLLPYYDPSGEKIASDILRHTHHTGIGFKGDRVFLFVTATICGMGTFRERVRNLNLDGAIFLDGGGSSQLNWKKNKGIYSSRKLSHGIFVKGVK